MQSKSGGSSSLNLRPATEIGARATDETAAALEGEWTVDSDISVYHTEDMKSGVREGVGGSD